ncbi:MAG: flavin reductase [Phycisphaerales bacterium]|nr:flavin reductase [Phycisphaerales bacterium]
MQTDWIPADRNSVLHVLDLVPAGRFLLSSAHGETRAGVIVRFVQQCAVSPPMIFVALEKGQPLSPVIRDSRIFAVCPLHPDDRSTVSLFERKHDHGSDPFLGVPMLRSVGGAPVPMKAMGYIDCELIRHMDIDSDHEVYVGMVHGAWKNPRAYEGRETGCCCVPESASCSVLPNDSQKRKPVRGATRPEAKPPHSTGKHSRRIRPAPRGT